MLHKQGGGIIMIIRVSMIALSLLLFGCQSSNKNADDNKEPSYWSRVGNRMFDAWTNESKTGRVIIRPLFCDENKTANTPLPVPDSNSIYDHESTIHYGATGELNENAYGLGVHSDQYGRAVKYIDANTNKPCGPLTKIQPDKYGLGGHADQYGNPIKVVPAY